MKTIKTLTCIACNCEIEAGEKASEIEGAGYSLFICLDCAKRLADHAFTVTEEVIEENGTEE